MTCAGKKLIEVALPLPEINDASAYDKMPGIGPHPKGIHHWWARLPLPTARAVLFASVVDDPSEHPETFPTEEAQNAERERLFDIIRRMMQKKLHEHPEVYAEAREEMLKHCDDKLPSLYDPFAGGGSIPLEANRLGFEAHAGDLNPIAVLLNKCNLELIPPWIGHPPVNPEDRKRIGGTEPWRGTYGLAADVRYYRRLIGNRAQAKIGYLYPNVKLPKNYGGGDANVIAWVWARTVASPSPAAQGKHVPLISTYFLSSKKGGLAWLEPVVDKKVGTYRFEIEVGTPTGCGGIRSDSMSKHIKVCGRCARIAGGTKRGRGSNFECLLTGDPISEDHVRVEGKAQRLGLTLLAVVASVGRGRIYLPATHDQEDASNVQAPAVESGDMPNNPRWFSPPLVGFKTYTSVFISRQQTAMVTLSDSVKEIRKDIQDDASRAGLSGGDADTYARTVTTFLALALDRCADFNNALCRWSPSNEKVMNLFGRQAIPMVWDFAEANILGESVGSWSTCADYVADCIEVLTVGRTSTGQALQVDAATGANGLGNLLVSTDPPYYDNMGYGALSDFFYVWLRRTVGDLNPDLFSTVLVPKMAELTASPERFDGDKEKAREHFESGFRKAFSTLREKMDIQFPLTVYYAFKQEDEESGTDQDGQNRGGVDLTTGWETMLEALISSGFQIAGTWPVRASQKWRMVSMGTNALASYIVLACRPRQSNAPQIDRRSFINELKRELPPALRRLQQGNIAPVDFAQAAIGPGMAVYSRYSRILEGNGTPMSVRTALSLINQTLTEVLSEQEDEFDADTRWALAWFEQHGFGIGDFGNAELLSKAKVTSVAGLQQAGLVSSKGGDVRLLRPEELPEGWDPAADRRPTVWEMTHHLLRLYYHEKVGDEATAELLRKIGTSGEISRDLAYRLFNVCEKKKWSQEAQAYNALVLGWPEIARLARESRQAEPQQASLL
jgi:putative DNA methylase